MPPYCATLLSAAVAVALSSVLALALVFAVAPAAMADGHQAHERFGKVEPRSVTDAEFQKYLGALEDMMEWSKEADRGWDGESDPQQFMGDWATEQRFQQMIREHGFSGEKQFIEVHTSVWQAFSNKMLAEQAPTISSAMGQSAAMLEQYKSMMSPEEYA